MMIDLLRELVDTPSTTGMEAGVAEIVERELAADGFRVERQEVHPNRWNVVATREGETVYGRGACDTKGGIVAMLEAGRRLRAEGARDFGYLFVVGEEVDHSGAKAAATLGLKVRDIILCEPTRCRVIAAQKGVAKVRMDAEGRAAHSGFPHRGVSAVDRLLAVLETLRHREWPTHDVLGETFFNVGLISGGVAANVLAPAASAELMFRTVGPTAEILSALDDALVDGVTYEVLTENSPELFDVPDGYETGVANFNTDASFMKSMGRILLGGPGDIEVAHSAHEHITLEELDRGVELYTRLGRELLSREENSRG